MQKESRNWRIISQLNYDIRENVKLLSELGLGTPMIAAIRSKLEKARAFQQNKAYDLPPDLRRWIVGDKTNLETFWIALAQAQLMLIVSGSFLQPHNYSCIKCPPQVVTSR